MHPKSGNFTAALLGLEPGTEYEVVAVAVGPPNPINENKTMIARSAPVYVTTMGESKLLLLLSLSMCW